MEKRIDPEDGFSYTYDEIASFYRGYWAEPAIDAYWNDMKRVKARLKKAKTGVVDSEDPDVKIVRSSMMTIAPSQKKDPMEIMHLRMMQKEGGKVRKTGPKDKSVKASDKDLGEQNEMAEGIDFFTKKDEEKFSFTYSVRNSKLTILEFTIDIGGSTNMHCTDDTWEDGKKKTVQVQFGETVELGTVERISASGAANLKINFNMRQTPLDASQFKKANEESHNKLQQKGNDMDEADIKISAMGGARYGLAEKIRQKIKDGNMGNFLDTDFFPGDESLYEHSDDPGNAPVQWRRPCDFMEGDIYVFHKGDESDHAIDPRDIHQGHLGDCWLLAAISACAEFPPIITNLFVTKEYNPEGVYELRCYKDGLSTIVIVDDYFPCSPTTGSPCYSRPKGSNELWMLLLEKAWAKLYGTYQNIEKGISADALMSLCGFPAESISLRKESKRIKSGELFALLKEYDRLGYVVCAGTEGEDTVTKDKDRNKKTGGIVSGHAYTVKTVKEAETSQGLIQLLELRNPHGNYEWQGDWSDKSDLWTDEMVTAFKPIGLQRTKSERESDYEDGLFWMSAKDFFRHFSNVDVCFYERNSMPRSSRTPCFTKGCTFYPNVLTFEVSSTAHGFIALIQNDIRSKRIHKYEPLGFHLYSCTDRLMATEQITSSGRAPKRFEFCEIKESDPLKAGHYCILISNPARVKDHSMTITVQLKSPDSSFNEKSVKKVKWNEEMRAKMMLASALATKSGTCACLETKSAWLNNYGLAFAARNVSSKKDSAEFTFDFGESVGLDIFGTKDKQIKKTLPKGGDWELIAEMVPSTSDLDDRSFRYTVRYS